jgi:hypothetical protein
MLDGLLSGLQCPTKSYPFPAAAFLAIAVIAVETVSGMAGVDFGQHDQKIQRIRRTNIILNL